MGHISSIYVDLVHTHNDNKRLTKEVIDKVYTKTIGVIEGTNHPIEIEVLGKDKVMETINKKPIYQPPKASFYQDVGKCENRLARRVWKKLVRKYGLFMAKKVVYDRFNVWMA